MLGWLTLFHIPNSRLIIWKTSDFPEVNERASHLVYFVMAMSSVLE